MKTIRSVLNYYVKNHVNSDAVADPGRIMAALVPIGVHFGRYQTHTVAPKIVEAYVRKRRGQGIGNGTIRYELGRLVTALNYAAKHRQIGRDDVPYIPLPEAPPPADRWLTDEEVRALLSAATDYSTAREGSKRVFSPSELFVWILVETGARPQSVKELRWDQVDFKARTIDFYGGGRRTKKRRPVVPMSDGLFAVLRVAEAERNSDYVIESPQSVRHGFNTIVKMAGLEGVTPKVLRHTWGTRAAQSGVSLWDIAGVLGNSLAVVERVYAHHCPDHLRAAVNFRSG